MQKNVSRLPLVLALLAVVFVIAGCKQAAAPLPQAPEANTNKVMEKNTNEVMMEKKVEDGTMVKPEGTMEKKDEGAMMPKGETKTFTVSAANFSFDIKEMKVKKGDTVKIDFKNNEGFHDWVIDDFSARTKQLQAGGTESISFTADKTGTFEYYCSVGQHRKFGMVGKLIVE
jgi:plastocyanin